MMRAYKHSTSYPAYDHTSFNLEYYRGDLTASASIHVKYSWSGGGWWFGLRPEFDIRYSTDRQREVRKWARQARREATCTKCGKREFGPPGLRLPEDWDWIHRMDFCGDCIAANSYRELMKFS